MTPIFRMQFGSHVYGTNLPTSDTDYKGIFLPSPRNIVLSTTKETISHSTGNPLHKNTPLDIDEESFSLKQFVRLLLEGQTVALTMLFAPKHNIISTSDIYQEIIDNRQRFLHSGVSAFAGYCRQQANKYGIRGSRVHAVRDATSWFACTDPTLRLRDIWPSIEEWFTNREHCEITLTHAPNGAECRMLSVCGRKVQEHARVKEAHQIYKRIFDEYGQRALEAEQQQNVDWKALMHATRVAGEAKELLLHHTITYPRPDSQLLLQIRKGELPYQQVAEIIEQGLIDLDKASEQSTLPKEPDYQWADDFVFNNYFAHINGYTLEKSSSIITA